MNLYYVVTFLARSASALALLVCLITVYGEKLPSRNRFCVATKIPIELIGFEASLAQWSTVWYGAAFFLLENHHRIMFYFGLMHMIAVIHLSLTLYNSWKEVDWVDLLLGTTDIILAVHATVFMIWWVRLSETFAVLIVVGFFWMLSLLRHAKQERKLRRRNKRLIQRSRQRDDEARQSAATATSRNVSTIDERNYYEKAWSSTS
eukprot:g7059.t1